MGNLPVLQWVFVSQEKKSFPACAFQFALRIPGFSCEQLQQGYPGSAWVGSKGFLQSDRGNIAMVGKREKRKLPFNSKRF